jgi:hypothetical protein
VGENIEFDGEDREYHISSMMVLGNHSDGPKRTTEGGIMYLSEHIVLLAFFARIVLFLYMLKLVKES